MAEGMTDEFKGAKAIAGKAAEAFMTPTPALIGTLMSLKNGWPELQEGERRDPRGGIWSADGAEYFPSEAEIVPDDEEAGVKPGLSYRGRCTRGGSRPAPFLGRRRR